MTKITSLNTHIIPHGVWALTSSYAGYEKLCDTFLTASTAKNAWVVQTTSPSQKKYAWWRTEHTVYIYWMDVFSLDELNALGYFQHDSCHFYLHAELFIFI